MNLRVVDSGTYSEPVQQALERVLVDRLAAGEIEPTLRLWYRETPAVPLGRFQAYGDEVATDYVDEHDIDVVRRITGGGAMYVEPGAVITYSLYLPREAVSDDVEESYAELDQFAIDALRALGLDVRHEPLNDIAHPEGKIGGAAQLRTDGAVLHHTTMSYELDIAEMLRVLRIGEEKVSDKAIKSAEKRVARIGDHIDASRSEVVDAMIDATGEYYDTVEGGLSDDVIADARELADEQFTTDEWNRQL
ncbi:lipoate--protein ligase family protein [Halapricum hydrolyticum]|uniref:Lipoate--protein ligase family protein n=1 Tax=Halapricum hydrolyticum TaxID=2979991 RepID=A0AAE3IEX5_9EURY|nr:biotin/lipoate A/B protein ligase family protein [Halapricum hydrolyticum]MCU4719558.1 lipoate--protein ligase family protein [Halapricum hydrolyticum]MCU4728499.1 lipoate--protein ligase family protein [Halapricum hydrolyticum]